MILHELFRGQSIPVLVRWQSLEASLRAPGDWPPDAISAAFQRKDRRRLTAVFCMCYVHGFDAQILEALTDRDPAIVCEAVLAADTWEIDAAWPKIKSLVETPGTDTPLLSAASKAVGNMRPEEVLDLLRTWRTTRIRTLPMRWPRHWRTRRCARRMATATTRTSAGTVRRTRTTRTAETVAARAGARS
ncbi:hypothetical protein WME94_16875 [Sorangium sp. So ce429]